MGWSIVLAQASGLFALVILLLTLFPRRARGNKRRALPPPSERCKRNGPEATP